MPSYIKLSQRCQRSGCQAGEEKNATQYLRLSLNPDPITHKDNLTFPHTQAEILTYASDLDTRHNLRPKNVITCRGWSGGLG